MISDDYRWLSIGDKIPLGTYNQIHSIFPNVVNFVAGDMIVSLANTEIRPAPFMIVTNLFPVKKVKNLTLKKDAVIIDVKTIYPYTYEDLYNSVVFASPPDEEFIRARIAKLKKLVIKQKHFSIIKKILDAKPPRSYVSAFEEELLNEYKRAYGFLQSGNYASAVAGFKGRGYGFTPAGDDFNIGLLMGISIRQMTEKKELSKIKDSIYTLARGKSLPVNTFLYQAYHSFYNSAWKMMIYAVLDDKYNLSIAMQNVIKFGATSGADTITGFVSAWDLPV